ncbi:hypothetical protein [Clostridium butyricum]
MEKINIHSKIIYTGFLNSEKDILEHGFSVYPSTYSLLGFIHQIGFPISYEVLQSQVGTYYRCNILKIRDLLTI